MYIIEGIVLQYIEFFKIHIAKTKERNIFDIENSVIN